MITIYTGETQDQEFFLVEESGNPHREGDTRAGSEGEYGRQRGACPQQGAEQMRKGLGELVCNVSHLE